MCGNYSIYRWTIFDHHPHPSLMSQITCIIAFLYVHHSSTVKFFPLSNSTIRCWKFSHSDPNSAVRIFHSQSLKFTALLMGQTFTQKHTWILFRCWDFSHSKAENLQVSLMVLNPHKNNTTNLPNHPHAKSNVSELNTSTSRRQDQSKKN